MEGSGRSDGIALQDNARAAIAQAIREARGAEICGYLLVAPDGTQGFRQLPNRWSSPDGVFVTALDDARARLVTERRGERIVAWVHSHNAGLRLSDLDRVWFSASDVPWMVTCLTAGELRCRLYEPTLRSDARDAPRPAGRAAPPPLNSR